MFIVSLPCLSQSQSQSQRFSPGIKGSVISLSSFSLRSATRDIPDIHAANAQNTMAAMAQLAPILNEQVSGNSMAGLPNLDMSLCSVYNMALFLHRELFSSKRLRP